MTRRDLDPELVVNLYRQFLEEGRPSLARVAKVLDEMGIRTRTGRAASRQAVHYVLQHNEEGKELLRRVAELRRL